MDVDTVIFTNEVLVNVLVWAFTVTGGSLIGTLLWLGLGVIRNQREAAIQAEAQFKQFGQQLTAVKDLVLDDIHKHDVRITRLEEWRKAREGQRVIDND